MRGLRLLLALDLARLRGRARNPEAGTFAGALIPLGLSIALLWAIGRAGDPTLRTVADAVLLGMLVSGPVAFLAYGTLFRAADAQFLRRLGFPPRALYVERMIRYVLQTLALALMVLIPFAVAGSPLGAPALVALAGALSAWAVGAASTASAALAMAGQSEGSRWGCLMAGIRDRDLASAAPLAYAPVPGFLGGTAAAAVAAVWPISLLLILPLGGLAAWRGAGAYERAVPRFGPKALEMGVSPAGDPRTGELRIGRGLMRLLPARIRAAQARDGVVVGRRFPWATRLAWPVAIGGFFALARWGDEPATRSWVVGGVLLVLLAQALAGVGLGRAESEGGRWLDRSLGIGAGARFAARWLWGFELSLWLTVPIALAWTWWSGLDFGWGWIAMGGAVAAVGAAGSIMAAGAR